MTAAVTSKFRNSLWIAPIFLGVLVFVLIALVDDLAQKDYSPGNAHQIMEILAILIGLISFNTYRAVNRFIRVTLSPNELLFHYLLINKIITVNYANIVHESVVYRNTDFKGIMTRPTLLYTVKLKIELNTGQNLYLIEEYYKNFDELKEAIRRARFGLD
jgi:hypothetical protein